MKMKVKIFKRHRTFLYLGKVIPTYIQFSRLLPTKEIEPNHSFILSANFDQVSMPYISQCHFPAYLMQVKCEISGHVSRASRVFLSDFFFDASGSH